MHAARQSLAERTLGARRGRSSAGGIPRRLLELRSRSTPTGKLFRFDAHAIELHRSEAEGYFLSTTSAEPKVFVMWRACDEQQTPPIRPEVITVSYNEAARLMDGGLNCFQLPSTRFQSMTNTPVSFYVSETWLSAVPTTSRGLSRSFGTNGHVDA